MQSKTVPKWPQVHEGRDNRGKKKSYLIIPILQFNVNVFFLIKIRGDFILL